MRSFYQVNAMLKSKQKTDSSTLAYECIKAASAIPQVIRKAAQDRNVVRDGNLDSLQSILVASSRAILSLTMGFNRLSHVADGAQLQGRVTYAYVKMYADLAQI